MTTHLRSKVPSFLLAVIGTALSGTIAAFIVTMIYFATFQLAAAGLSSGDEAEGPVLLQRSVETDRCRPR
jgi:hypothetical protein